MSKYKEAIRILNKYRNNYYNSSVVEEYSIANALNILLPQITKEHTLLELYQLLVDIEEEYNTSDSILKKQKVLDDLRNVREEINQLEEELKVN